MKDKQQANVAREKPINTISLFRGVVFFKRIAKKIRNDIVENLQKGCKKLHGLYINETPARKANAS